jgi:hypothetical protein
VSVALAEFQVFLFIAALAKPPSSVLQAQYSEARIQYSEWDPSHGPRFSYSDSCILTPDFSLANTPEGVCKSLLYQRRGGTPPPYLDAERS